MRSSSRWYQPIAKELGRVWPEESTALKPAVLCQVELGLRLLERLQVDADPASGVAGADGIYTLLGGYPFATATGLASNPQQLAMIVNARHLLWRLRRRRTWLQRLAAYRALPERLRAYRVSPDLKTAYPGAATIVVDRLTRYDEALSKLPDFDRHALPLAPAGPNLFRDRRRPTSVNIPEQLRFPVTPGHDLSVIPRTAGRPLDISRDELHATAQWMENTERELGLPSGHWVKRLEDVHLETLNADGKSFQRSNILRLDRMLHLVGMVGAGKSTLMIMVAAWAARKGLRTTLVVGDVAEQLTLTTLFRNFGLSAAPVLGGTTRERHTGRLHRRLAARGSNSLLAHDHPGFDDLSTACVIDALRGLEAAEPLRYADAPCVSLRPVAPPKSPDGKSELPDTYPVTDYLTSAPARDDTDEERIPAHGCPIWNQCARHSIDRDMVDALIWVANPASLLQSGVPYHLNEERLRRLELACLRSDIIFVDEADRVQMQLDAAFAPSATLVTRGPESWLDKLHTHKINELARQGRLPLSDEDVERWAKALDVVSSATNRIYAMLINDESLRNWADTDYFSAWTLQEKLMAEWFPEQHTDPSAPGDDKTDNDVYETADPLDPDENPADLPTPDTEPWAGRRREVVAIFDAFRDDPLGDHGPREPGTQTLIAGAHDLMHTLDASASRKRVRTMLDLLLTGAPILDDSLTQPAPKPGEADPDPVDIWGTEPWFERTALRLEFTLLLATLHHRLDRVTFLWPQVEAALHLDSTDNELARRPPLDYAPVVPEAPMGNVLGFQYLTDDPEPGKDDRRSGILRFFRCAGVGRELLLNLSALGSDPGKGRSGPHVVLMSGTSWAGTSTRAHILVPVKAILKPHDDALEAIRQTSFRTHFLYDGDRALTLSGASTETRPAVLRQMITRLGKSTATQSSPLDDELRQIGDDNRRRALLLVGSYREATIAADLLDDIPRWNRRVRVLAADDAELEDSGTANAGTGVGAARATVLRRGDLASFADDHEAELLVAPLLAVERGHNILNSGHQAAFGTVFFLARPHPRPDDLTLAIFAINDWVARFVRDEPGHETGTFSKLVTDAGRLDAAGLAFRHLARREWRRLLRRRYAYSRLSPSERESFAWDQLVAIWQVIGRLVRGGVPARVVFVDAAFAPALADAGVRSVTAETEPQRPSARRRQRTDPGLLIKLQEVLAPYFDDTREPESFHNPADPALVRNLYEPLYDALTRLRAAEDKALTEKPNAQDRGGPHGTEV
ncbi:hypothetical protein [Micromonospora craterilacus]|uniref:pPIWI_RE_Z domain-containing protein n=1 Tax=Micromonospora craterilacus TaxID=1655439 RepID=UPI00131498AA|nr:hypothetical protein [Micromonospora craterilacus]